MDEQAKIIDNLGPKQEKISNEIQKQKKQYENLNVRIAQMKNKLQDASEKPLKDMTKGISKVIKSMGRWALAIFGIRSLYYGLRSLINTISEYNTELADKIKSIKTTIAFALEPVITKIVDLIYRLFQYLGYLIKVWTGKDIFASAAKNLKSGATVINKLSSYIIKVKYEPCKMCRPSIIGCYFIEDDYCDCFDIFLSSHFSKCVVCSPNKYEPLILSRTRSTYGI